MFHVILFRTKNAKVYNDIPAERERKCACVFKGSLVARLGLHRTSDSHEPRQEAMRVCRYDGLSDKKRGPIIQPSPTQSAGMSV